MCGRYTISHSAEEILERFNVLADKFAGDKAGVDPNYNVAPTNTVPIVVSEKSEAGDQTGTSRLLQLCKWGLVPFWVKDLKKAKPIINARSETLIEKPTFKKSLVKRRCVIPADSFYEWKTNENGKVPMRIKMADDRLFGFAGIYDDWKAPDGTRMRTVAIITVPPNELMKEIHDRMPAILTPETEKIWLDPSVEDEQALTQCLAPYPYDDLEAYVVSSLVNKVKNKGREVIEPASADTLVDSAEPADSAKRPKAKRTKSESESENGNVQLTLPLSG